MMQAPTIHRDDVAARKLSMLCARAGLPSMAWLTISARAFLDAVAARVRGKRPAEEEECRCELSDDGTFQLDTSGCPWHRRDGDPIHALTLEEMRRWAATGQWPARFDAVIRGRT